MQCPYCRKYDEPNNKFKVVNVYHVCNMTQRRRECHFCGKRFNTYEEVYKEQNDDVQCRM